MGFPVPETDPHLKTERLARNARSGGCPENAERTEKDALVGCQATETCEPGLAVTSLSLKSG